MTAARSVAPEVAAAAPLVEVLYPHQAEQLASIARTWAERSERWLSEMLDDHEMAERLAAALADDAAAEQAYRNWRARLRKVGI